MTGERREAFDWLHDPQLRHGGLRMIQTAVRRGWLDGPEHAERRADLVEALVELVTDPATPIREMIQAAGIMMTSISNANLRAMSAEPRKPRRGRMKGSKLGGRGV